MVQCGIKVFDSNKKNNNEILKLIYTGTKQPYFCIMYRSGIEVSSRKISLCLRAVVTTVERLRRHCDLSATPVRYTRSSTVAQKSRTFVKRKEIAFESQL